jgi:indole-3-glycerol phosphate synthase
MDILAKIIEEKKERVRRARQTVPFDEVYKRALAQRETAAPHALMNALQRSGQLNIIAEFKRRSPSKGTIRDDVTPGAVARLYESGGAAAISVLTEEDNFAGSLADLLAVKETVSVPALRKDFIVDEYQIFETAAAGADALLLIVAALDDRSLARFRAVAEEDLRIDALVEVHTKHEMQRAINCGARMIGVNNRNLKDFTVSLETSLAMVKTAPPGTTLVAESGLNTRADLLRLKDSGFKGFLIGEFLMRATQPDATLRELIGEP